MKRLAMLSILLLASAATSAPALAQEFQSYEGKNSVREGDGGSKKTVDGVDFWSDGAPPYKFKLLGYITDRRHKTGLVGMFSMSGLESSVAEVTKKNGGDAVIQVTSEAETVGVVGSAYGSAQGTATTTGNSTNARATGWSSGAASAVQKQNSKFAVIKYMRDATEQGKNEPGVTTSTPSVDQVASEPSKQ